MKRKVEKLLYAYKTNKAQIKNMILECEEYDVIYAVTYRERVQESGINNSPVEDSIVKLDKKKGELLKAIKHRENEIAKIDNAMQAIDSRERELIQKYYFDGIPVKIIAINMGLDQTYVSALKGKILKKLHDIIFF